MKKIKAFTLAEILITLGIIGVVAAITLPTLIKNYQKHVTVNKVKKFYTEMNKVLQVSKTENGDFNNWQYHFSNNETIPFFNTYLKPYMKNVLEYQEEINIPGDFSYGVAFKLSDGTMFVLKSVGGAFAKIDDVGSLYTHNPEIIFYTSVVEAGGLRDDVKYPSRERFYFVIDDNGFLVPPNLSKSRTDNIIDCKRQYIGRAFGNYGYVECSTVIIKDGWKISDDYPW